MQNEQQRPSTTKPGKKTQHRSWCFVTNNYTEAHIASFSDLRCRYIIFGKEVAPLTGTPHLQGFVSFTSAKTRSAVAKLLPGSHLLVARGTGADNFRYCSKDGDFIERGDRPMAPEDGGEIERDRWTDAWAAAKRGAIEEVPAEIRIRCYSSLRRIERDYMPAVEDLAAVCGTWITGPSGSGKTHAVVTSFPGAYPKPLNKWWDGYQNEDIVYLDDIDPVSSKYFTRYLKIWSDRYQFIAEIKGGSRRIRPKRFIVTSQYTIADCFPEEETQAALNRRFRVIIKSREQSILL